MKSKMDQRWTKDHHAQKALGSAEEIKTGDGHKVQERYNSEERIAFEG